MGVEGKGFTIGRGTSVAGHTRLPPLDMLADCPSWAPCPIRAQRSGQQRSGAASRDLADLARPGQTCRSELLRQLKNR